MSATADAFIQIDLRITDIARPLHDGNLDSRLHQRSTGAIGSSPIIPSSELMLEAPRRGKACTLDLLRGRPRQWSCNNEAQPRRRCAAILLRPGPRAARESQLRRSPHRNTALA